MTISIKKTNGATIADLADQTIDTTSTSLSLIGRGAVGYSKAYNENMVHMLENFAGPVEPVNKMTGQLWYDSTVGDIKMFSGSSWSVVGVSALGSLQARVVALESLVGDNGSQTGDISVRLATLQTTVNTHTQQIADLASAAASVSTYNSRITALETLTANHTGTLTSHASRITVLEAAIVSGGGNGGGGGGGNADLLDGYDSSQFVKVADFSSLLSTAGLNPANLAKLNAANVFTADQTVTGSLTTRSSDSTTSVIASADGTLTITRTSTPSINFRLTTASSYDYRIQETSTGLQIRTPADIVAEFGPKMISAGVATRTEALAIDMGSSTITLDFAQRNKFVGTLNGNKTFANPINMVAGQTIMIILRQDGTGSRTVSWGSAYRFPNGTAPTLTKTANAYDIVVGEVINSTTIFCDYKLNYS